MPDVAATPATKAVLLDRLSNSGQEHVLEAYDTLTPEQQLHLTRQFRDDLGSFNVAHLNTVLRESLEQFERANRAREKGGCDAEAIEPPPAEAIFDATGGICQSGAGGVLQLEELRTRGLELIARGEAAVIILAGGSGTRLGVSCPKGMYVCAGLRRKKSLFQIHCEKVLAVQRLAAAYAAVRTPSAAAAEVRLPLLIMTSVQNDAETQAFFRANAFFGLSPQQVRFFTQSSLPCYDAATHKILMESPYSLCLAPGGNGGIYQSLAHAAPLPGGGYTLSPLQALEEDGVRYVQISTVDNIIARIGDPGFFGFADIDGGAHVTVKTTPKTCEGEKVGVFARRNGRWGVVEYTEIGAERAAEKVEGTGALRFNCANIACHTLSTVFLRVVADYMAGFTVFHVAQKRIANTVAGSVDGIKLEAFIFDVFHLAEEPLLLERSPSSTPSVAPTGTARGRFRIMQVNRFSEFSAVKNADSVTGTSTDSPATAVCDLHALHSQWVREHLRSEANTECIDGETDCAKALRLLDAGAVAVELSPLLSYEGEGLGAHREELVRRVIAAGEHGERVVYLGPRGEDDSGGA